MIESLIVYKIYLFLSDKLILQKRSISKLNVHLLLLCQLIWSSDHLNQFVDTDFSHLFALQHLTLFMCSVILDSDSQTST